MRTSIFIFAIIAGSCWVTYGYSEEPAATANTAPIDASVWRKKMDKATQHVTDESSCQKAGGQWVPMGMLGKHACNLPTPDAGKLCNDDDQCAMVCQPDRHDQTKGYCSKSYSLAGGCWTGMKYGQPRTGGELCID